VSKSVTSLHRIPIFGATHLWIGLAPRINITQKHVFEQDGPMCSKYDDHFRFNSQRSWGGGEGGTYMAS
jgi:hypothetical protein